MNQVSTKQTRHQYYTRKRRELRRTRWAHCIRKRLRALWFAHFEGLVRSRKIGQNILFVNGHGPTRSNTCISVFAESKPEGPASLFPFRPISGRGKALFHIQACSIQSVQAHPF